jgi:hypothetical protein
MFQESEVRIRPEALEALQAEKDRALARSFPLLESADDAKGANGDQARPAAAVPTTLDALLGGGGSDE